MLKQVSHTAVGVLLIAIAIICAGASASEAHDVADECRALHRVTEGETLLAIALNLGATVPGIAKANGIVDPNLIESGQRLCIPYLPTPVPPQDDDDSACRFHHIVRDGQTLEAIAFRYDYTVRRLSEANDISDPDLIVIGQRLCIPHEATPTPLPRVPGDGPCRYDHLVRQGETLELVARGYESTVTEIVQANPDDLRELRENIVYAGVTLCIP